MKVKEVVVKKTYPISSDAHSQMMDVALANDSSVNETLTAIASDGFSEEALDLLEGHPLAYKTVLSMGADYAKVPSSGKWDFKLSDDSLKASVALTAEQWADVI